MLVDFGASRLSVVLYHLEGEDEGEGAGGGGIGLREVASASNVFACGDAVEHRVIHWCERRKPFQVLDPEPSTPEPAPAPAPPRRPAGRGSSSG